jgi:hypothetical protein
MEVQLLNRVDQGDMRQEILRQIGRATSAVVKDGVVTVTAPLGMAEIVTTGDVVTFEWRGRGADVAYRFWMERSDATVRALGEALRRVRQANPGSRSRLAVA